LHEHVQTRSGVRKRNPESLSSAGDDLARHRSMCTRLVGDPDLRGLGLVLLMAVFCKQNVGLGLHDVLLLFARPVPPLITIMGRAVDRAAGMQRSCASAAAVPSVI
jgi:hypothetical protein